MGTLDETSVRATADALVSSGLAKLGYNYINLGEPRMCTPHTRTRLVRLSDVTKAAFERAAAVCVATCSMWRHLWFTMSSPLSCYLGRWLPAAPTDRSTRWDGWLYADDCWSAGRYPNGTQYTEKDKFPSGTL